VGVEVCFHAYSDGTKLLVLKTRPVQPQKKGYHYPIEGTWVSTGAPLHAVEKRKTLTLLGIESLLSSPKPSRSTRVDDI
jgi:hypothetical protein